MKMWIARDRCGYLWIHEAKPFINKYSKRGDEFWSSEKECYEVNQDFLPEVTFENSPMEVELKLIEK